MQNIVATAKFVWVFVLLFHLNASQSWGQTTLFNDNFNTNNSATFSTTGAIGTYPNWSVTRSGNDWGARVNSNILELSNDASATGNSDGWAFGYRDVNALAGWNTILSSNTGTITWEFNMRQIRTDPAGFGSGSYGVAFVLAGTSATSATAGSGYAVVLGQSGSTDPIRLASYNNGLQGTLTNIITSNTSGLTDFGTNYLSVRVTYVPSTNTWQLFLRNDGTTAFVDPATGTLVSQGTAVNNTYTSTAGMRYIGGYWQGSIAATQTAFFDNVYLKKTSAELTPCNYSQDFNSMGTAGTAPPAGWNCFGVLGGDNGSWPSSSIIPASGSPSAASSGTLNNTLLVSTGSGVSSNTQAYNFGASGNSDRALGTSPTSGAGNILELTLTNATGANVSSFNLSYDVRRFTAATNELPGYWIFVSSNNGSTWTEVSALRPNSTTVPNTVGVSNFGPTLVTLPAAVANGSPIKIRWVDDNANETSPDQIIGLDNVVLSYGLTAATLSSALTTSFGTASNGVSFTATGSNVSGNITVTPQSNFEVSTTSASAGFGTAAINVANNTTVWLRLSATAPAGTYNNVTAAILSGGGSCSSVNVSTSASGNTVNSTVTFNGNGATGGSMSNQTASSATNLTVNAFTRTGYTFAGWATSAGGSVLYANNASYPFTANITLFAVWTPNNLTITHNTQGGSAISNGSTTTGGSIAASPGTPTRAGYTFNGWFTASSGGTAIAFPYTHNQTANFTLFAQWTANTLTVTFDSQGGSAISNGTTTTGGTVANPGNPTRAGFTFDGWFVAASGGAAITFPYSHGQTANFTLFAQWTVAGSPTLNGATLGSALSNVYGSASTGVSFTASGTFLTGNITVTSQTGYEVSTSSGSGYGASVSVASGTTVWVRFAALQNAGTYNDAAAAVLSSAGATPVNVLTSGSGNTVSPRPLSVTAPSIASKIYDGTTTAGAVTVGTLSGFVGTQTVTATGAAANYSSANATTYAGVVITYTLSNGTNGGLAANYSLANGSATGVITPKALSITAPSIASKVYDATTTAGAVTVGTLSGLVGSETLTVTGAAANYSSANAGTFAGVVIAYTLSNGTGLAANYSLANGSGTGVITPKALTISPAPTIASKVYNATTTAGAVSVGTLSGLVGSETLTVTGAAANYLSTNVGSYAGVVITYTLINGSGLAANYSLANGSATGVITPKALTITAPTIASKAYDATTTAGAVTVGTLSGFVGIETVTTTGSAAAYSSANVGTYTNVTVSYTLANGTNGGLAANYSLAAGTATGVITQRALTITATDATKEIAQVLSGGAGSTAFTSSGLQGGQTIGSVTITYGAAAGSTGQGATAGTYAGQATPSAAIGGTFNAANYSITYAAGAIIVTNPNAMVLATLGTAVCENFSGLATSGTSSTMPTGWAFSESGTNANSTYSAGTGSGTTGETYSFGTAADRTLGGLRSGSLIPTYGARIFNNTGSTISTITIAYTGKTWRVGAASRSDRIDFQYSSNATSLTTGTWTDENNLDYANPGQATGSGSVQHSANISYTMQGLSLAPGASIWIRWNDADATGSDDGMGVDDVCITPIVPCTAPDLLVFDTQPSNVLQDATMSTVTIRAYCSATGLTATGFNGDITLAASGGGCGYASQTVAAVNGIATFGSIVFTRSAQTGITLTASASGFSNLVSNTFNVSAPAGSITTVAQQDFGSITSLSYTTAVGGLGVFNTSNTRGVSGSNCMAFYYDACLSGASGNSSTAIFSQSSGLTGLSSAKLTFAMAWGGPQLAGANCDATSFSGTGLDSDDFVRLETSINGGAYVTTFQLNGNSNKQYGFSNSGVSLNHNANQTLSSATEPSAFTINLPSGTTSVNFRFTFKANRRNEIIYLDDLSIQGNPPGAPVALPIANAGASFNGCNGGPNQLQGSATQTVGTVAYSWTPTASLNNANISNPQATNTTTTTYTLSITDADNCSASSTVTVSVLNGTAGLWTGAENADWFNCQNWASGNIPTSTTDVTIPDVTNDPDIANGTAVCRNLSLSAAGSVLNMSGSSSQLSVNGNFSNIGNFISAGNVSFTGTISQSITSVSSFQNLTIANASGVVLNSNVSVNGTLTLQNGNIAAQSNVLSITSALTNAISRPGTGHIIGNLQRTIATGTNSYTYPIGDASSYSPVVLNFNSVTAGGNVTVNSTSSDHPQLSLSGLEPSLSVNRFYTVANSGLVFTNYSATFNFVAGDKDPGITTANLLVGLYSAGWAYTATANPAATSIQATDLTAFGDFAIAECKTPAQFSITGGGEYCLGGSGLPVGLADSENGVTYELLRNSISLGVTAGTGNSLSFGNQLDAGTYGIVAMSEANASCSSSMTGNTAIVIREIVPASVAITTSAISICVGESVTFTATLQYGGTIPSYQWKVNGVNAGTNSNTFTSTSLLNGDSITCEMTSSETCPASATVLSNSIQLTVLSYETPVISISPDGGNTICAGNSVVFNSSIAFGGGTPQYNWLLNGVSQIVHSPSYTATALSNGNQVQCILTSDYQCVTSPTASSNTVTMNVTVQPAADGGSNMTTCGTSPYTFANGASNSNTVSISWTENGVGSITAGVNTLTPTYTPAAGDLGTTVTFTLTGAGLSPCDVVVDNVQLFIDTLKWYYVDADGDGFGDPNSIPTTGCVAPAGRVNNNTDCCDASANINPMCEWWVDQDGDGSGSFIFDSGCLSGVACASSTWPAQLIPYYPQATINQGLSYTIDCNDNSSGIEPGNGEICGNLIDDNCNVTIDEGCSVISNDSYTQALSINTSNANTYYPNCATINGSLLDADISAEGNPGNVSSTIGAGRDSWYRFVAPSTAAQIRVVPNGFNAVIELRTAAHPVGQVDVENVNSAVGGTEIMNLSGLTVGQTYFIAIRNYAATAGGTFTLCLSPLLTSGCGTAQAVGGLNLCNSFKAVWRGGTSYTFNFTGAGGTAPTPFVTTSATTTGLVPLSTTSLALRNGGVYNVRVDANFAFTNGIGGADPVITLQGTACSRTMAAAPLMEVMSSQRCALATLNRSSWLRAVTTTSQSNACTAVSYNFRFTRVADCAATAIPNEVPFIVSSPNTYLALSVAFPNSAYPLQNIGYWKVETAPVFGYAVPVYGPSQTIKVNNTAASMMLPEVEQSGVRMDVSETIATAYPNPGNGQFVVVSSESKSVVTNLNVIDELGRKVEGYSIISLDGLRYEVSFPNTLPNGLYYISWYQNDTPCSLKWLVIY